MDPLIPIEEGQPQAARDAEAPELRDLAANLSPQAMRLWPQLLAFSKFLTERTLQPHSSPRQTGHATFQNTHASSFTKETEEETVVGTFLFSLMMAGALYRVTLDRELMQLTTDNIILQGRWFQNDAFQPIRNAAPTPRRRNRPARRNLQIRFPLPLMTRCLFYRLALFNNLTVQNHTRSGGQPVFLPGQPLIPERIRTNKNFLCNWLAARFKEFQESGNSSYASGHCFPKPAHWTLSREDIKNACQAHLLSSLPPWVVAGLSRRWLSRPSTLIDIVRVLLDEHPGQPNAAPKPTDNPHSLHASSKPLPTFIRPAPSILPRRLHTIYTEVNQLLRATKPRPTRSEKTRLLKQIHAITQRLNVVARDPAIPLGEREVYNNARLLFLWLASLTASRRSFRTAQLYFFNMLLFIYDQFGATAISAVKDPGALVHMITNCMLCYDNPASQSNVKKSFQSFFRFVDEEAGLPPIPWRDPELLVYRDAKDRPVFTYDDFDRFLTLVMAEADAGKYSHSHAVCLQSFFILCFYAGLRREEAAMLTVADFHEGPETLLWVRHSKTKAGVRVIPLSLLMPRDMLTLLQRQYTAARELAKGRALSSIPLLPSDTGTFCKPESLGAWASTLMKRYLGAGSAHDLRHSFATWFLVRWYLAFHAIPETVLPKAFRHQMFSQQQVQHFRELFLGRSKIASRKGATSVTRPLFVLQTLIGHACPEITLSVYAHSLDWIYYLHQLRAGHNHCQEAGFPDSFTVQQAANLLNLTPASLHTRQKKGQHVPLTPTEVVQEQMRLLGLR